MNEQSVKFRVIRQEFSTYRVENGQILRMCMACKIPVATRNNTRLGVTKGNPTEGDRIRELKFEVEKG